MPLETRVAHCMPYISVYIFVCAHHGLLISSLNVFSCTPDCKYVYVWIIPVFLFGRIQYSEEWVFGENKNQMKNDSIWNDDTHERVSLCVLVRATCTHTLLWGSANILVKISHNLFNSTRLQTKNKLEIRLEKRCDPQQNIWTVPWPTWGCAGSSAVPAAPAAPPSSLTSWHWHNGLEPGRRPQIQTPEYYFHIYFQYLSVKPFTTNWLYQVTLCK